jgi:hypothetical protein
MDPILYVLAWLVINWPWIIGGLFLVACALVGWSACHINKTPEPKVKSIDMIDEEIRAERLQLHNTSRDYADLQLRNGLDSYPRAFVDAMLSAAFRSGAKWQADRDR